MAEEVLKETVETPKTDKRPYAFLMSKKEPKFVKPTIAWTTIAIELAVIILIGVLAFTAAGKV